MSNKSRVWFLLGAGTSAGPPASISLWREIATDTQQFLYRTLEHKVRASGGDGYLHAKDALEPIAKQAFPETILESLTRVYGGTVVADQLHSVLSPADAAPNPCHHAVAHLCKQGRVAGILTTNFDTLIEKALGEESVAYRVTGTPTFHADSSIPLIKIHGTIDAPSSLVFTRNQYYLGLLSGEIAALRSHLAGCHLVVVGYSGNDIDVFPVIRSMIEDRCFSGVQVLDRAPLAENPRYDAIRHLIDYCQGPAEESLCRLAGIPAPSALQSRKRRMSALVPANDKYSAALFFGDCLLSLGLLHEDAFRLFFLTQDIVEEETGDIRQLCVSLFAKSCALLAMGDNCWGESEYSSGRTQLHSLLANSNLAAQQAMLSEFGGSLAALRMEAGVLRREGSGKFMSGRLMPNGPDRFDDSPGGLELLRLVLHWELRARIRLCFAALAAAMNPDCPPEERQEVLQVPQKLMDGFRNWEVYFTERLGAEELPLIPLFYAHFFRAYRMLLIQDPGAASELDACIQVARRRGFYLGVAQGYFLKKTFGIDLTQSERQDYMVIQELCGVDERVLVAPLFRPGPAFRLSITNYRPPV